MKKLVRNCILIFAAAALLAAAAFVLLPAALNGKQISSTTLELLKFMRSENDYLDVDTVYVNGIPAVESQSESWWLCSLEDLPGENEVLQAEITADISEPHRYYSVVKTEITAESIERNEPVYLAVFTLKGYKLVRLHFTSLPIMSLNSEGDILRETDTDIELNGLSGKAHTRGTSSRIFNKRSYKIELDEKTSFLDLREDDDWVIISLYNDPERIRSVFGGNLWYSSCAGNNDFGIANGYEFRYIELFRNGDYSGLYALGYKPDQKQFDIGKNEFLYSKTEWEADGIELQGGKTKEKEEQAWKALSEEYGIDWKSAEDLWLFINFCAGADNNGKNYYFALKEKNSGKLKMVYCPWDLDLTWGNEYNWEAQNYADIYTVSTDTPFDMKDGPVFEALQLENQEVIASLKKRYAELREGPWSDEALSEMIGEYEELIFSSGAYSRDLSMWPGSTLEDPALRLDVFREYVLSRAAWMDEYIERM
ncbi:MAG: CotH kinase family protein [Eubacteriales bacterium]|nr:CotH kinase family protein [Eubacteriales bacterium]